MLQYIINWKSGTPPAEELWLAQEDLWLQREMLRIIREANDGVATFKKTEKPPAIDKARNEVDHQVFTNPNWSLDLALASEEGKPVLRSKLTNTSNRRQVLGINFEVRFKGNKIAERLAVNGEPVGPNKTFETRQFLSPQAGNPQNLESIKQLFDWRTAPIKRIDKMVMGYHSNRTAPRGLKAYTFPQLAEEGAAAAASGQQGTNKRFGESATAAAAAAGGGASGNGTESGLHRDRYSEITPQVRRVPIAMVLTIDQSNIQDVLTAFEANIDLPDIRAYQ
jgi:hypothetical protein